MSLIKTIQNKPREQKIRLMWVVITVVVIFLLTIWILFNRMGSNLNRASSFFKQQAKEIQTQGEKMYKENK